jgi:cytochrome P450
MNIFTDKDSFMASQANLFFKAGSEGIAISISNALYEIANNCYIQNKLRNEITKTSEAIGDQIIFFNDIKNMKYLDKVFKGEF